MTTGVESLSVIIPARNEALGIGATVRAVLSELESLGVDSEVIVVDDGSSDDTEAQARSEGARVIRREGAGNPGAARNFGAAAATGGVLVFLDADCMPAGGWLATHVAAHESGKVCVGGSLAPAEGLSTTARWDYYFSSYHIHPGRPPGPVRNHTPANFSVEKALFDATTGFNERHPVADGHEELLLQAALHQRGVLCYFEPTAVVHHRNRPGFGNLLRRTYRWAYSSIQAKAESGAGRLGGIYRRPWALLVVAPLTAPFQALYIVYCWLRVGRLEPLLAFPFLFLARIVYAFGMMVGGWRWLTSASPTGTPVGRLGP